MSRKKKLLFVIPTLRIGGAEKALVTLFKAMDSEKYDADLFLFEHGGALQQELPDWIHLLPENPVTRAMTLELRYYFPDLLRKGRISAAASRLRITVQAAMRSRLHKRASFSWRSISRYIESIPGAYDTAIAFLENTTAFFVLDKVTAKQKIGWIHTDFSLRELLPEEITAYAEFDRLVTISPVCRTSIETAIPQACGRVEVIENIVLPEDVRARAEEPVPLSWSPDKKHLITLGRLEDVKGIDLAARACKQLKDMGLPVCWHVFGDGSKKAALTGLIDELQLRDSFILEGSVPNPLPYLKAAEIFVQPSRQEGKSIALDEAKLLGKPIVVTDYPSVEDQIQDQITGLIVAMYPEKIAEGIASLLNEPEKCALFGRNCLALPSHHKAILQKFYSLIDADMRCVR